MSGRASGHGILAGLLGLLRNLQSLDLEKDEPLCCLYDLIEHACRRQGQTQRRPALSLPHFIPSMGCLMATTSVSPWIGK